MSMRAWSAGRQQGIVCRSPRSCCSAPQVHTPTPGANPGLLQVPTWRGVHDVQLGQCLQPLLLIVRQGGSLIKVRGIQLQQVCSEVGTRQCQQQMGQTALASTALQSGVQHAYSGSAHICATSRWLRSCRGTWPSCALQCSLASSASAMGTAHVSASSRCGQWPWPALHSRLAASMSAVQMSLPPAGQLSAETRGVHGLDEDCAAVWCPACLHWGGHMPVPPANGCLQGQGLDDFDEDCVAVQYFCLVCDV